MTKTITKQKVANIARLTQMSPSDEELENLTEAFAETLDVVNQLRELDVKSIEPTHQVTGLTNVMREDRVIKEFSYTQQEALANAKKIHNGYFMVPRVLEKNI